MQIALAPFYQWIEKCTMGNSLQRARMGQLTRLAHLTHPKRVLIVGEGDGNFLLGFVRLFPCSSVTVVESSASMVARAQARLRQAGLLSEQIQFQVKPLLDALLPPTHYDLIVTLFFFDNFEEKSVKAFVAKLRACAKTQAYWLLTDFCVPNKGWRRLRAKLWMTMLYRFFGYLTGLTVRELPQTEAILQAANFKPLHRQTTCAGLLFSSLYQHQSK